MRFLQRQKLEINGIFVKMWPSVWMSQRKKIVEFKTVERELPEPEERKIGFFLCFKEE